MDWVTQAPGRRWVLQQWSCFSKCFLHILRTSCKRGENCSRLHDGKMKTWCSSTRCWLTDRQSPAKPFYASTPTHSFFDEIQLCIMVAGSYWLQIGSCKIAWSVATYSFEQFLPSILSLERGGFLCSGGLLLFGESQLAWLSNCLTLSWRWLGCNLNTLQQSWKNPRCYDQELESLNTLDHS